MNVRLRCLNGKATSNDCELRRRSPPGASSITSDLRQRGVFPAFGGAGSPGRSRIGKEIPDGLW